MLPGAKECNFLHHFFTMTLTGSKGSCIDTGIGH